MNKAEIPPAPSAAALLIRSLPGRITLALCVVLALEWLLTTPESPPAAPSTAATIAVAANPADSQNLTDWQNIANLRPLFTQTRRPTASTDEPPPTTTDATATRITGIIFDNHGTAGVLVIEAGAATSEVLHVNDQLGPETITQITPTTITLHGPTGDRHIRPSFKPLPPASSP